MQHDLKLQKISFLPQCIQCISSCVLLHPSPMQTRLFNILTFSVRHLNAIRSTANRGCSGIKRLPALQHMQLSSCKGKSTDNVPDRMKGLVQTVSSGVV
jgi:hypothetical protein